MTKSHTHRHHHERRHRPHGHQPAPDALDRAPSSQQGGVADQRRRGRSCPIRSWSAATPPSSRQLAAMRRRRPLDHRPRQRAGRPGSTRSTSTPRPPTAASTAVKQAIAAGKHVYCEKPIATDAGRRAASSTGWRSRPGVKNGVVQDKLWLPGLLKLKMLIDARLLRPDPLRARRVRLLGLRGRHDARPAALVELPQGGRRRHHHRHALPLALRARQPLRRGAAASPASARRTSPSAGTSTASPTLHRRRFRLRHLRAGGRRRRPLQLLLGVRVRRDDLLTLQVDGTKGSAVAGLRDCWIQPYGATPRPVWNPDVDNPIDFFDGWQQVPRSRPSTTPSRPSGSCSCATSSRTSRSAGPCSRAPRACSWPRRAWSPGRGGPGWRSRRYKWGQTRYSPNFPVSKRNQVNSVSDPLWPKESRR